MTRSKEEIEVAAAQTEQWLDDLEGQDETTTKEDRRDLRSIAQAVDRIAVAEARLHEAVTVSRARGRSWAEVGAVLGTTRQAARQRFGVAETDLIGLRAVAAGTRSAQHEVEAG